MNKHVNKNGAGVPLTEQQKAKMVETELRIMKSRELRRQQEQQTTQAEINEIEALTVEFAKELGVDTRISQLSLDVYRFIPRQR